MARTGQSRRQILKGAGAAAGVALLAPRFGAPALAQTKAEVDAIVLAPQYGLAYLPMHVMKQQKLIEKHLAKNGLPNTKVDWSRTTGGAAANEALLSGAVHVVSGGVGPRVFKKVDHFVPYAQMLAGATYARAELRSDVMDMDSDDTFFSLQPGVGLLMYFNSRIGAQVAVDYRWVDPTANDGEDWSEFRFGTGIVVGFGSR